MEFKPFNVELFNKYSSRLSNNFSTIKCFKSYKRCSYIPESIDSFIFNFIVVFESFDDEDGGAGGVGGGGGGSVDGTTGVDVLLLLVLFVPSFAELDSDTCPSSPSYKLLFSLFSF